METQPQGEKMMKQVEVFTDGSCLGNPGKGGIGVLLRNEKGEEETLYRGYYETTNNRMEMRAVIEALSMLKAPCLVRLYSDSQYLQNGIQKWIIKWRRNNWLTSQKQPVKNKDLWLALDAAMQRHQVQWVWVKGHSGHRENELCDELAKTGANNPTLNDEGYISANTQSQAVTQAEENAPLPINSAHENALKHVKLFVASSCLPNGQGGFGILLRYNRAEKMLGRGYFLTTSNRMGIRAITEGLSLLKEPCTVELYCNNLYLRDGMLQWLPKWKNNSFQKGKKQTVKHKELWIALDEAMQRHQIQWAGKTEHRENELCGELAKAGANNPTLEDVGYSAE